MTRPSTPLVAVASIGGTITMTSQRADGRGVEPTLGAGDLLRSLPATAELTVEPTTLATIPGASLSVRDVLGVLDWARQSVVAGACGAVVIQGTDTIEETAYLLDLYWDHPEPLVVTGAMRPAQAPGADGPANLSAAVLAAAGPQSRNRGVLVVLADQIHAAAWVRKSRSSGPDVFRSPSFGPLGFVEEGAVVYGSRMSRPAPLPGPPPEPSAAVKVALLETYLGDTGDLLELVDGADYGGIVLSGFGVGHVSRALAERVEVVASRRPLVVATRTGAGSTYTSTYGFAGSESDLLRRGAILAGWLDARKARLLLSRLLTDGRTHTEIVAEFRRRGRQAPGA